MPEVDADTKKSLEPVRSISDKDAASSPRPGTALCLSGGGYRAMIFHIGALIRLNELGLLKTLTRISSVSGGSLTAGVLGLAWKKLQFNAQNQATNLQQLVVDPIMKLAGITLDVGTVIGGLDRKS